MDGDEQVSADGIKRTGSQSYNAFTSILEEKDYCAHLTDDGN